VVQILGGRGDMMSISVSVEKGIEKIKNVALGLKFFQN
jgi:hypothetical protein